MQTKIKKDLNSKTLTFALTFYMWTQGYRNCSSVLECSHAQNDTP